MTGGTVSGVGIDLISVPRIRQFLKTHAASKTARLLSPLEQKQFKSRKKSPLIFAKFFTAKEAFFKSLDKAWLGLEGFGAMEVRLLPAGRFKIRLLDGGGEAEGCFFSFGHYVGAQVIR
jgi:phosphopantetheine--protein transferase-like protein